MTELSVFPQQLAPPGFTTEGEGETAARSQDQTPSIVLALSIPQTLFPLHLSHALLSTSTARAGSGLIFFRLDYYSSPPTPHPQEKPELLTLGC